MYKQILELIITIIISFMDCIIAFYLCNNLIEKKPKMTIRTISIGLFLGIVVGIVAYYMDEYTHQLFAILNFILILKLVSKKRMHDVLILLIIVYLCIAITQILVLLILTILKIDISLLTNLIAQIFILIIILSFCTNIPLYKLLYIIEKEIILKFTIYILLGIILIVMFYLNFDSSNIMRSELLFSILIIISISGIYVTLRELFYYTKKVPMRLHDTKNLLIGLYISTLDTMDIDSVSNSLEECMVTMGMDSEFFKNTRVGEHEENILSFIEYKKLQSAKKLDFIINIAYCEPHRNVSLYLIIYMLGTLLDNAIESKTNKPILIEMYIAYEALEISVANQYKRRHANDFQKMFQEGYSTKSKKQITFARGYGLSNLSNVVKSYGGEVLVEYRYNITLKDNYLKIKIEIS